MRKPEFVYVTYIRTTIDRLWDALTEPEFTRQYWCETYQDAEWKKGGVWRLCAPDGRIADAGEVLEIDRPRHLAVSWRHELSEEVRAEGFSRMTFDLETVGDTVKLTVTHDIETRDSKLIESVSGGWPHILASLKSLLETGKPLEETRYWPKSM
jgi:uncharacterized protein YndB with AHSA1/START domain